MKLVVFKFVQLGDNVVFLPVIQSLRSRFPSWQITLLTTPREAALYSAALPEAQIVTASQQRFNSSWQRPWELASWWLRVRLRRPDACLISFDQGNAAHLIARHSGAAVRVGARIGHVRISDSVTTNVPLPKDGSVVKWHWAMARELVNEIQPGADWPTEPPSPDLTHLVGQTERNHSRRTVIIHAGSNQEFTRWPLARFAALAARLVEDTTVIWIDRPETVGVSLPPQVQRASPKDLGAFTTLLASASLFVGNNSGPMHLANALGVPGVVISGPTVRGWDPYWHRDRWTILRHPGLPCVPCEWSENYRLIRDCHLTTDRLACLKHWTVDAVEAACRTRLADTLNSR
jgi:ADP-heptose:LPS heptosyltransferase